MKNLKISVVLGIICLSLISCEKNTFDTLESEKSTDNLLKSRTQEQQTIQDLLLELYHKNDGVFEIRDRRINKKVINHFLVSIGEEPIYDLTGNTDGAATLGKKRCTKWKNGRRFCVQRKGFLHWKFGTEHCGGGSEC